MSYGAYSLHGAVPVVLDGLDLNFSATHGLRVRSDRWAWTGDTGRGRWTVGVAGERRG